MAHLGAQFANIMVEFETENREMAVDVPDSFIGISKTPPKYPPPGRNGSARSSHNQLPTPEQSIRIEKYNQDIQKRNKKNEDYNLLRHSLRYSAKMRSLRQESSKKDVIHSEPPIDLPSLLQIIERLKKNSLSQVPLIMSSLVSDDHFQRAIQIFNKIKKREKERSMSVSAKLLEECLEIMDFPDMKSESLECRNVLTGLMDLLRTQEKIGTLYLELENITEDQGLLDRLSHYSENNIRIVKMEKTSNEPLGATVKNEEEAVVIGRIIHGGAAERSGLIHEGDEILEVNDIQLRGKNVNEVCDILTNMQGTLTLLVVPSRKPLTNGLNSPLLHNSSDSGVIHIKSHIDYDPEDDPYVPCRELGISFQKGDILHVINQEDPHWWQAYRDGEDDQALPGLIPSSTFQFQREAMKQTMTQDSTSLNFDQTKRKSTAFLCAKKSGRKKRRKVPDYEDDLTGGGGDEMLIYEEVALYYPRSERKRPIVLVGPPNIGRHQLRQKLMEENPHRFAPAIPHTSRPKRSNEMDGQDYHFISRLEFEQDILNRKFVEHGEYEKYYYGTSLEAIRMVIQMGRICILNLHPQSLKILKASDLMPFVVFVAPPSIDKLKQWNIDQEVEEIIERARDIEEAYGNFFDMVIVYSDPAKAYSQLFHEINLLEREPQWVPFLWQKYF